MFTLNARIVPIVAQLASTGIPMGILSNTCEAHWDFVNNGRFGVVNHYFDVVALSYQLGAMKPDPQIYAKATEMANVEPGEIFFFDDKPENVEGALRAGYDAIHYTSPESLVVELSRRGIELNY
jgi:FMN phosphatase YigB (HAD superfamily)